jgi:signal transduction histidine kinase
MNRFESIISAIPDLVFRFDRAGYFIDYYATKSKLLAVPPDEIVGKNLTELFPPHIADTAIACIERSLDDAIETSFEYSLSLPDGVHFFEARLVPGVGEEVVSFIREITEMHNLRKKNQDILSSMNDLVFWIDNNGVYKDFFAGKENELLISADVLIGSKLTAAFKPELADKLLDLIRQALATNVSQLVDYSVSINGIEVFFEGRLVPSDAETVVFLVRNISQRKEIEIKILEQNQLLEKQNRELVKINSEMDEFVYRTSHDLRAPLSSIMGLVDIGLRAREMKEVKSCLTMIKERVMVQDSVIHEIMDFAKNIRIDVKREPLNLKLLIFQAIDALIFNEGAEKINFKIDISDNFEIISDSSRLTIIFNNILSNAIKYHDHWKTNRYVFISLEEGEGEIKIHIEDNGQGISDIHHEKIFNMFYRASDQSKGSGLGLYIVKDTVLRLNGKIEFASTLGKGSRFTFSLPR